MCYFGKHLRFGDDIRLYFGNARTLVLDRLCNIAEVIAKKQLPAAQLHRAVSKKRDTQNIQPLLSFPRHHEATTQKRQTSMQEGQNNPIFFLSFRNPVT
jgi:hypothetical protein